MTLNRDEEKLLRVYLLGDLAQLRAREVEERLLRDDEFVEQVLLVEDELIEDYVRGALGTREKSRFEGHFLSTPRRRQKLMLVESLRKRAAAEPGDLFAELAATKPPLPFWRRVFFAPRWQAAALAVLVTVAGLVVWRVFFHRSAVESGLLALNDAYKRRRPLEARVTGLSYAPFSVTRGADAGDLDRPARDRSAAILHEAVAGGPSAEALHALGRVYLLQREFDQAIVPFEEALKSAPDDPRLHSDIGAALFEKGKQERLGDQSGRSETTLASSLSHLNRALELDGSLLDARFNRALLYQTLRLTPQALEDWEKYVTQDPHSLWADEARRKMQEIREQREKVSRRDGDLFREFISAHRAGDQEQVWRIFNKSHFRTGNSITSKLIDGYLDSAAGGRTEEAEELAQALTQLGELSSARGGDLSTSDVARLYRSASSAQRKSLAQARGLMNAAHERYNQSGNDQAIELYTKAKGLFEQVGNHPEAMLADFWIGFCYSLRADTQFSLSVLNQLLAHCEDRGYKWLWAITLNGLANVRARAARYSQAVEDSWAAYKLSKQAGDENGMLRSLNMLAGIYRSLGNYRRALQLAQKGVDLGNEISADASQMIGFYATSAWSFNALGYYAAALDYEEQALSLGETMKNPLVLSRYRVQMGLIQGRLKNYNEAIRNIRLGIEIGQRIGQEKIGTEMTAYARLHLGRTYRDAGLFGEAQATLGEVIQFSQQNDETWLLHEAEKQQLLTHIALGEVAPAREELRRVLNAYEEQREKILEESNRNSFFDKEQDIYDVAIDFAHTYLADTRQSFEYSESSRARSLLDASAADWRVEHETEAPDLRFSGASKPLALDEIRRHLPDRAQLLQYAVLKDKLVVWYATKDRFDSRTVPVGGDELAGKVDRLLYLVSQPPREDDRQLLRAAAELYDLLILPAADLLDRDKQLCVIPDKALHLLPFGVLFSSSAQRYLAEDFTLTYAASANIFVRDTELARAKGDVRGERLLGVGNPRFDRNAFPDLDDLPAAAREAAAISSFYDSYSLLTGPEARKTSVQKEMRRADVLHLATHYLPDSSSPMLSKLLLASAPERVGRAGVADGVLHAHEIYRLKPARPRLVILSACRTGVEGYFKGEGAVGLMRPFKAAGVPLVIASLWPVDSQSTSDLMVDFHRLRKRVGLSSAEALKAAQAQMLKHTNPSYRHPYYWASFALTGGYSDY